MSRAWGQPAPITERFRMFGTGSTGVLRGFYDQGIGPVERRRVRIQVNVLPAAQRLQPLQASHTCHNSPARMKIVWSLKPELVLGSLQLGGSQD